MFSIAGNEKLNRWVLALIGILLLTIILPVSIIRIETTHSLESNDLGIVPKLQRKDTKMLCLQGCSLSGSDPWDSEHETTEEHSSGFCAITTIAMINHYKNGTMKQDRLCYYVSGELYDDGSPENDLRHGQGIGVSITTSTFSWALNGASIDHQTGKPSLEQIVQWLNSGRPIMIGYGIHVTLIDGVDGEYLHVIDPATGSESRIHYDDLGIYNVWIPPSDATGRLCEESVDIDSDNDGVVDFDEANRFFTDPYNSDSDFDGVPDKAEIISYTFLSDGSFDSEDIRKPDSDNDGLRAELDYDSDDGGTPDGLEDLNHNGKLDPGETDPFKATDDPYQMPAASFSFTPENPSANEPVTFDATASYDLDGNIVSYTWDFGDENATTVTEPTINYTYLSNGNYTVILNVTDNDGLWSITSKTLVVYQVNHDLALVNIISNKTVVCESYGMNITVTVENQGDSTENFNVTVYWNSTEIDTEEVTLTNGSSETITFYWNTSGLTEYQTYVISAYAHPVQGEIDTDDNEFIDGEVLISMVGDIAGLEGFPDRKVDMRDIGTAAQAFGSYPGHERWNPIADINNDGKVDMKDIGLVAKEFGRTV